MRTPASIATLAVLIALGGCERPAPEAEARSQRHPSRQRRSIPISAASGFRRGDSKTRNVPSTRRLRPPRSPSTRRPSSSTTIPAAIASGPACRAPFGARRSRSRSSSARRTSRSTGKATACTGRSTWRTTPRRRRAAVRDGPLRRALGRRHARRRDDEPQAVSVHDAPGDVVDAHVVERMRLEERDVDGQKVKFIVNEVVLTDPKVYTTPIKITGTLRHRPDLAAARVHVHGCAVGRVPDRARADVARHGRVAGP